MTDLTPAPDAPVGVLDRPVDFDAGGHTGAGAAPPAGEWPPGPRPGRVARFVRGKESDALWVRPALLTLLAATAVLYLWDLGASGWGNSFYSAAVQAGTKSWKAFFFGSSDASSFITVDKPPAFLWPMEISARIFGLNSWSVLAPQALEGVATVGLVYLSVRRWFSAQAAILGGAVVALTPVAALMFRYNNPDAMLALLLAGALYATMRGLERAQTKWLVLAGALVGFGFITKMMQAFLILPVMAVVYLLAAPTGWRRRVWQVFLMGVSTLVAAGWWVAAVVLTPAADRPYVGGSQDNNILNLIFGYNGFGRITGNETGSVGGGTVRGSMWGPTGLTRLFNAEFGNMMSWLLPGALVMGAVLLAITVRARRTDRERAALLLWGGSLVSTGLVISLAQGIIHPYYLVALAAPLGGLVGIATMGLWQRRHSLVGRLGLAAGLAATVVWTYVLLGRTSDWFPALRSFVAVVGTLGVVAILALPLLRPVPKLAIGLVAALGLGAALAAPLFSTVATATTPHAGAIPSVTPDRGGRLRGWPRRRVPGRPRRPSAGGLRRRRVPRWRGTLVRGRVPRRRNRGRNRRLPGRWKRHRRFSRRLPGRGGALVRPRRRPACVRWRRRPRRDPRCQPVQRRVEPAAAIERHALHLGRCDRERKLGRRLPARQRRAGDGHRRVQRDGPGADAGPVRDVRRGGPDPLLHRRRARRRPGGSGGLEQRRRADHFVGRVALHGRDGRRGDRLRPHVVTRTADGAFREARGSAPVWRRRRRRSGQG